MNKIITLGLLAVIGFGISTSAFAGGLTGWTSCSIPVMGYQPKVCFDSADKNYNEELSKASAELREPNSFLNKDYVYVTTFVGSRSSFDSLYKILLIKNGELIEEDKFESYDLTCSNYGCNWKARASMFISVEQPYQVRYIYRDKFIDYEVNDNKVTRIKSK